MKKIIKRNKKDIEINKKYTQYFSKWRGVWVDFKNEPTRGQVIELLKYKYLLR